MAKPEKFTDRNKPWNRRKIKMQPYQTKVIEPKKTYLIVYKAIELAHQNGIKTAYSNDSFELWFVLHFQLIEAEVLRDSFYQILSDRWNCNYEKIGKTVSFARSIYDKLEIDPAADLDKAIRNAERLFENKKHLPFCDQNPCTTVYQLVQELKKYL